MKDQLEDFVRKNREGFDDKEPSEKVWSRIDSTLFQKKNPGLWNSVVLWRAAAVIFMVLSIYLFVGKMSPAPRNTTALNEFSDVERYYIEQISHKTQLIEEFQKNEGLNGFTHDFQQLEAMYMVLKEEMKNRPSQKVKDALVLNLLVRIDLLNQQLQRLDEGTYDDKDQQPQQKSETKNI